MRTLASIVCHVKNSHILDMRRFANECKIHTDDFSRPYGRIISFSLYARKNSIVFQEFMSENFWAALSGVTEGRDAQGEAKETGQREVGRGRTDARRNAARRDAAGSWIRAVRRKRDEELAEPTTTYRAAHRRSSRGRRRRDERRDDARM